MATEHVVILITTSTPEEAQKIARALLETRKAACVNIVPSVDSLFWWQGKLDSAREALLIVKTRAVLIDQVLEVVKQVHSYSTPEVIALPIVSGNNDYLKWIDAETQE